MAMTRKIEIYSAGCDACDRTIARIRERACPSCEIVVLEMKDAAVSARARDLGIESVPAVLIDGVLADCCAGRGPDMAVLERAGLGRPLS